MYIGDTYLEVGTSPNVYLDFYEWNRMRFAQKLMYIGDTYPEVGTSPRVYLNFYEWNRIRFAQKRLSMLPHNPMFNETNTSR
ncbi:unnamed protein product [Strongylus vulgaris]|uniref:Uncharacterized protein n=1 Tax=Strongylus vulgaris TaxID=40348 RepID=A0A3P7JJV2_STRVU|nr:unnamed protein product [Strongylus vulgaris]